MEEKKLCDYGCGKEVTHQFKNGKWCCSKNRQSCPSLKRKSKKEAKREKPETARKGVESKKRNGTTGFGKSKPDGFGEAQSIRMKNNNPMKNPETVMKNFRNHKREKSGPEKYLEKVCDKINFIIQYIGDGSIFINGRAPDFIIPETKKLIEVYDSSFIYSGEIRNEIWIEKLQKQLYGYDVLFLDFHYFGKAKNFNELVEVLQNYSRT